MIPLVIMENIDKSIIKKPLPTTNNWLSIYVVFDSSSICPSGKALIRMDSRGSLNLLILENFQNDPLDHKDYIQV